MSGGVTTNYGLKKPTFNTKPWDQDINGNFDLLDAILFTITQIPNIGGVWRNSTQYTAGQNVLDANTLTFYQCVATNVSAATGTFAADRIANPTYWTVTSAGGGTVRYDQGQALTSGQQAQARTNIGAIAQSVVDALAYVRYDAAQTLTYNQILQVLNNLLIDGTESILTAAATTDIGNAGSQNVRIDGTTTIVSFGARPNKYKILRFTGSLVLTNSASLVLPGGGNITTQAGDTAIATSDANNNWYIRAYQRKDGTAVVTVPFSTTSLYTVPATPSTATTLAAADFDLPYNVTGTTTITVGNVGNGFRTGPIKNANPVSGIVTLAVPSSATLDGVANATLLLFPYQKARIIQTGATSYISEWLDRTPLIQSVAVLSTATVSQVDLPIPVGWSRFGLSLTGLLGTVAGSILGWRTSPDGGTTFKTGASDYTTQQTISFGTSSSIANISASYGFLANAMTDASDPTQSLIGEYEFYPGDSATSRIHKMLGRVFYINNTPQQISGQFDSQMYGGTSSLGARANVLRIFTTGGALYGNIALRGKS